jgi:hypothetical protein
MREAQAFQLPMKFPLAGSGTAAVPRLWTTRNNDEKIFTGRPHIPKCACSLVTASPLALGVGLDGGSRHA